MTAHLAITAATRSMPVDWRAESLRRVAQERGVRNIDLAAQALSLSSTGTLYERTEETDRQFASEQSARNAWVVWPGDLVVNPMWLFGGAIGVSDRKGAVSPDYRVYALSSKLHPRFLHHLLRSTPYRDQYRLYMRAETTFDRRITKDDFNEMPVVLPPLPTQRAIADYLDAETAHLDALVGVYRSLIHALKEQRAALTVAGVSGMFKTGARKTSALPWLETTPSHWGEPKMTLLARLGSGHTPSREHPEWWVDCTVPWITTGEVWQIRDDRVEYLTETREMISELGVANSSAEIHPAGTVVLSRTASAGFSAIMAADMATSQDFVTWTCGARLRPRYLLLCLRAMRPDLLGRLAMGSTHQTIYVPDIQSIRIPLPPTEDQDEIVEWTWRRLAHIDAAIDAIARQIDLLLERRQALITAAVTGQLEIPGLAA